LTKIIEKHGRQTVNLKYLSIFSQINLPAASGRGILTGLIFHSPQVAGNLPIEIKIGMPGEFRIISPQSK